MGLVTLPSQQFWQRLFLFFMQVGVGDAQSCCLLIDVCRASHFFLSMVLSLALQVSENTLHNFYEESSYPSLHFYPADLSGLLYAVKTIKLA
jgi:hypothetical protein